MEERDDDTAQTAREAKEARRFSDPTLEALRVQRDAYAASEGEAAVIYDKLRDELVVAKQRLSATARGETWPNNFRIPQLTYEQDHPGEDLPTFHFAFEVTLGASRASLEK